MIDGQIETSMERFLSYLKLLEGEKKGKQDWSKIWSVCDASVEEARPHEAESLCLFGCSETAQTNTVAATH